MVFPLHLWLLFAAAMIISSIGFKNYVWFISLGYGFSIAGEGLLMLLLYRDTLSLGTLLCCLLFILYGCRLGGYLAIREFKSTSYKKNMTGEIKDGKTIPFGVKIAIWITCAALYVLQVVPVLYRLHNGSGSNICTYIGAGIMLFGVIFESAADLQKNAAKKVNPRRFVDTGLYRIVRCPNYLGEMIFWTGVLISGLGALSGIGQWIMALIGYAGIIFVMFSGARRLEIRQNKNYGNDPEYQQYIKTVPIMVPFIPLYSVEKYKWLVA
jgi:steroid 5-alpha reductase family enzyme